MSARTSAEFRTVTDARTLRALAHPLRLTLLELIEREGTLTATRAAKLTGENSANCSFHLRELGKHGYIEQAEPTDGREKPWRRVAAGERVPATRDRQLLAVSATVARLTLERLAADAADFTRDADSDGPAWQDASLMTNDMLYLTADELSRLSREISAAIERHSEKRSQKVAKGQDGKRAVRVTAVLFPLPPIE